MCLCVFVCVCVCVCASDHYHDIFDVAKEVAKVDMEEITMRCDHDVVIVTITNTLHAYNIRQRSIVM